MRALGFVCLFMLTVSIAKAQFEENKHYVVLETEQTAEPTVTEFFSLFCGHCFQFEGLITDFKKALPSGTNFEKSHVTYLPKDNETVGEGIVRAFVAMEKLGKREELSKAFFIKIHLEQQDIANLGDIKKIFLANGVSETDYDKAFNDPEVIKEATAMSAIWLKQGIASVPTIVVNGKYRLNMGSVKSLNELNSLVGFLLEKK